MKKNTIEQLQLDMPTRRTQPEIPLLGFTVGLDLGDKKSHYCMLDSAGEVVAEASLATTPKALTAFFTGPRTRVALEVGTHSRWVSQLLTTLGHQVIVANPRKVRAIAENRRKNDRVDACTLARLARADWKLLHPVHHRGESAQQHLMAIRIRASLVESRTRLINSARGLAKSAGFRLASCDADSFTLARMQTALPEPYAAILAPLVVEIEALTAAIAAADQRLAGIASHYTELSRLTQVFGVGTLTGLTFLLTLEDPARFRHSRDVGSALGLVPASDQSGAHNPELHITKEGDRYLRALLVEAAQLTLGVRGPDSDLKRAGQRVAARGGKNAKKRAVVAVARRLAVLLHKLWRDGEAWEPLRNAKADAETNDKGKSSASQAA